MERKLKAVALIQLSREHAGRYRVGRRGLEGRASIEAGRSAKRRYTRLRVLLAGY